MTIEERQARGFPVEVALFDTDRTKHREAPGRVTAHSDAIYSYTFAPDTTNDGIFCDAPGSRPDSIAWGMTLDPVLSPDDSGDILQASAIYIETTGEELLNLIACLQSLYDVNFTNTAGAVVDPVTGERKDRS